MLPPVLKLEVSSTISTESLEVSELPHTITYEGTAETILIDYFNNVVLAVATAEALEKYKDFGAINSDEIVERLRGLKTMLKEQF